MDPYAVLGVPPTASARELRAAYLSQARRHHPDSYATADARARADAESKMREVNQAWEFLGTEAARAAYDRSSPGAPRSSSTGGTPRFDDEPWQPYDDMDDIPMPAEDFGRATGFARWIAVLPVALFATAFGLLVVGSMTGITPLLALAVVCILGAIGGFLVAPLVALAASARSDKRG